MLRGSVFPFVAAFTARAGIGEKKKRDKSKNKGE